jgi:ssDNA-binding Zn-finger/Zn-ribbon topoisomerase 1
MNGYDDPVIAIVLHCPYCDGKLRKRFRRADNAPFVGCTGYPDCRYTCDYDEVLQAVIREARKTATSNGADPNVNDFSKRRESGAVTVRDIRALLAWAHPDRHSAGPVDAHELGVRLTALLDRAG